MSFAIMRGQPTKAQVYLDGILDELVAETGREEDKYSYAKVMFKCMKDNPDDVRQIDGSSGEIETNRTVLERSVRTALALQDAGVKPGDVVIGISRNHVEMSATYFGPIFAGILPFHLPVGVTVYELNQYIKLSEPQVIFTEKEYVKTVEKSLSETGYQSKVVVFGTDTHKTTGHQTFSEYISGYDKQVEEFRPAQIEKYAPALLIATSGSTGFPKAAIISSIGLVAQISTFWAVHETFPTPSRLVVVLSNAHWIAYTMNISAAVPFRCSLLFTSETVSLEHVRTLFRKYKPTFVTTTTALAQGLLCYPGGEPDDLKSLNFIMLAGSAVPEKLLDQLKHNISPGCLLKTGYGLTEMHGGVSASLSPEPTNTLGTVINIFKYKIIDEHGNSLGINEPGEMCIKSDYFKLLGYLKDEETYKEAFTEDGYFRTGDKVYEKEEEEIVFLERLKFLIKYQNHHVYPSELEDVISKVEGVAAVAVCGAEKGPAALVVARPGFKPSAKDIHRTVNSTLSDEKKLRGGVTFVSAIPLSVNGKIDRQQVKFTFQAINENDIIYDS